MIKKIIIFSIKGFIILLTFILVALLVARKLFPPEKLKTLATSQIETAINRQVTIGDVWLNPFKGISVENVIVYERGDSSAGINDSSYFFKVDKVLLKYHFFALLKKEIRISKVVIENPSLNLIQDKNLHWNFDDLLSLAEVDSTAPDTATTEFVLPLTLDMKELVVKNITANLKMSQQETELSLQSGGI
ncbi:AsmA family protein, partial [candidate division KSB1 bacterium]|nr:AsmA family protein [candidate division KSB1 bacterium]